ncbi:MAG: COX15/CtaA family protein [Phycisphaeraceae bacterium]
MTNQQSAIGNLQSAYRPWLHRYACLLVVATFILVASGGNVTSRDAGLAVPDGFTVYGHFLWTFPVEKWVGNVFHEHIHRLKGSVVGLMCIALVIWLWRTQRHRPWLGRLSLAVLALVIVQGIMGGLRVEFVNWFSALATPFAILHGITGQVFLCMTVLVAAATSRLWIEHACDSRSRLSRGSQSLRRLTLVLLVVLLIQLSLGAAMRHTGSGLAIPDFPASYGQLVPPLSPQAITEAHDALVPYDEFDGDVYPTPAQVGVHFAHRVWSLVVLGVSGYLLTRLAYAFGRHRLLVGPILALAALLIVQLALGAAVIWMGRHPDVATAHQATGAAILATAALLTFRVYRVSRIGPTRDPVPFAAPMPAPGARVEVIGT